MATARISAVGARAAASSGACPSRTTVTRRSFNVSAASGVMWPPLASITVSPRSNTRASLSVIISNCFKSLYDPTTDPDFGTADSDARRRDGGRNPARLPRRSPPRRRAQGRLHLSLRPGSPYPRQGVARFHGDVELRQGDDDVRRGEAHERPRPDP